MEVIFNITNIKSAITFLHLAGLALGVGGAWILDLFIVKHLKQKITKDNYQVIDFVSKWVSVGLFLLWISGFFFIAYYYFFKPELLSNQKVWSKIFIVIILTINGIFVHYTILPKLKAAINKNLINSLSDQEVIKTICIGTISFVSWLFPIVLGVTETLNFSAPAIDIIMFYIFSLCLALIVAGTIGKKVAFKYRSQEYLVAAS